MQQHNSLEKTPPLQPRFAAALRVANQNMPFNGRNLSAQCNAEIELLELLEAWKNRVYE